MHEDWKCKVHKFCLESWLFVGTFLFVLWAFEEVHIWYLNLSVCLSLDSRDFQHHRIKETRIVTVVAGPIKANSASDNGDCNQWGIFSRKGDDCRPQWILQTGFYRLHYGPQEFPNWYKIAGSLWFYFILHHFQDLGSWFWISTYKHFLTFGLFLLFWLTISTYKHFLTLPNISKLLKSYFDFWST